MRKPIAESRRATTPFTRQKLDDLKRCGFHFVQIKGLSGDDHYDYIEPSRLILIPLVELPDDPGQRDIYEPIESAILASWASGEQSGVKIFV